MLRAAFVLLLCACGGSQVSEKRQPEPVARDAEAEPSRAAPGTAGPMGCIENAAVKKACEDKGDTWQYGYPPPRHCSGVDRGPEPPEPTPACECIEHTEYQRLVEKCAEVP